MKKLISLILACIFAFALLPGTAGATTINEALKTEGSLAGGSGITVGDGSLELEGGLVIGIIGGPGVGTAIPAPDEEMPPVHSSINDHEKLTWNCNTKYHWKECACGARLGEELHVDPKDALNDTCICGYHFSSNADLVTLWVKGCPGIKYFDKNKTEYKLNAYTYKDVKEIKISTRTHDSEATVELPEDLTLQEGENKFEVKVTSENQKVTKVYTLIINKEAKK